MNRAVMQGLLERSLFARARNRVQGPKALADAAQQQAQQQQPAAKPTGGATSLGAATLLGRA